MNSPYRAHPTLPPLIQAETNTIPFPVAVAAVPKLQGPSKLERLVAIDGEIRQLPNATAIALHALNETRTLVGYEQAFWIKLNQRGEPVLGLASSVARVEAQAPLTRNIAAGFRKVKGLREATAINLKFSQKGESYPLQYGFSAPFVDRR